MPQNRVRRRDLPKFDRGPKAERNTTGCGKVGFTLKAANRMAGERETLTGIKMYVQPCLVGCSQAQVVYHLTRQKPSGKIQRRLLQQPQPIPRQRKRRNKNGGQKKRHRRDVLRAQIADWENEGGAIR